MRQITITGSQGTGQEIAKIAFAAGISEVTMGEKRILNASGLEVVKDSVEIEGHTFGQGLPGRLDQETFLYLRYRFFE